ncbi:plasmid replication, integration and excision activator [Microlunatus sp. Gsoil 973]|nr:plasmid replication, integration and excision activator [Microlunatus sp. Gsoil 973]
MALQRRFAVSHGNVFPMGAFMKGSVEPVSDFDAPARPDGSRPQQVDKESGLPLWQVTVLDADDQASRRDTAVSVKIAAQYQPVPPDNTSGTPWRPVEFVGLTALAYVDDSGSRPRVAWSFRADDLVAPGEAKKSASSSSASSGPRAA